MFPLSCARARARTTFRLARTEFLYWRILGIGLQCYCSQSRPMRAQRNKIRGNIDAAAVVLLAKEGLVNLTGDTGCALGSPAPSARCLPLLYAPPPIAHTYE